MNRVQMNTAIINDLLTDPDGPVGKVLERAGVQVETAAKRNAPVDTGRLRSSISHELTTDEDGLVEIVGSDVEYAIYQELGTRYIPAHPYLRPALGAIDV